MRLAGRGLLRVRVGRAVVRAEAHHRGVVTWAGEAAYQSLEDLTDTIARLAAEPPERCRRVDVVLERPPVQTRTLTELPPVKDRELAALVSHQAARFFRKNGHPLVTDAVWAKNGKGRLAHAAAIEESVVEAIVAGARAAGLVLEDIAPADASAPLLLLPTSERAARERAVRKRIRRLAFATGGVWTIVFGLVIARLIWERRAVDRSLASLEAPLAAVLAARRELRDAETTLLAISGVERERGQSLTVLAALIQALPDSAVLTSVTWNAEGPSIVTGYARRAAEVLARLERASPGRRARFDGPVIKEGIAGREWDRFTIVFEKQAAP
jgi:hypothetical protein